MVGAENKQTNASCEPQVKKKEKKGNGWEHSCPADTGWLVGLLVLPETFLVLQFHFFIETKQK